MTFKISCFDHKADTKPKPETFETWETLVDRILGIDARNPQGRHTVTKNKDGLGFSPATFLPGTTKLSENVDFIYFAVLDIDEKTDEQIDQICKVMEEHELAWAAYTSHSHNPPEDNRYRFLIPFDQPVPKEQWPDVWKALNGMFLGLMDRQCSDSGRMYYFPAHPEGRASISRVVSISDGVPLCVGELLGTSSRAIHVPLTDVITSIEARALATKLKKKGGGLKPVGEALASVAKGEVYAEKGGRDTLLFQMLNALAEAYPHASRTSLVMLFVGSISAMSGQDDPITMAMVEDKAAKALEKAAQKQQEAAEDNTKKRAKRILQAFRDDEPGRSTPYSTIELDAFKTLFSEEEIRWILQKVDTYYIFFNGSYKGPYTGSEAQVSARDLLAPAWPEVETDRLTTFQGLVPKSAQELSSEYGEVAKKILVDLSKRVSKYDWHTRTLTEATCPPQYEEEIFNQEIDDFLRIFAGEDADTLLDWLSLLPNLKRPLTALYLEGAMKAGKTLMGLCCSSLWSIMPVDVKSIVGSDFNEDIVRCPVVLAEEGFPKNMLSEFRQIISQEHHTLKRKGLAEAQVKGYLRLVITSNNLYALASKEDMTNKDNEAVGARITQISASPEAAVMLAKMGEKANDWKLGPFARHVRWLAANRKVTWTRFGVTGGRSDVKQALMMSTGSRTDLLEWVVSWLQSPKKLGISNATRHAVVVRGGKIWANHEITKYWDVYLKNTLPPTIRAFGAALHGLSGERRNLKGKLGQCYPIETDLLIRHAEETGAYTRETLFNRLKELNTKEED